MHDGESVRVHGTLDLSIWMLLLPDGKDPGEAVLLCSQPVQRRKLAEGKPKLTGQEYAEPGHEFIRDFIDCSRGYYCPEKAHGKLKGHEESD